MTAFSDILKGSDRGEEPFCFY